MLHLLSCSSHFTVLACSRPAWRPPINPQYFKKLSQAKEGPWLLPHEHDRNSRNIAFLNPSQDSQHSPIDLNKPVHNATEDAIDTIVNDALEAYYSPWLVNLIKTKQSPTISALTLESSHSSPSLFQLPLDGYLPAAIVEVLIFFLLRILSMLALSPLFLILLLFAFPHINLKSFEHLTLPTSPSLLTLIPLLNLVPHLLLLILNPTSMPIFPVGSLRKLPTLALLSQWLVFAYLHTVAKQILLLKI
jgi:hypothetical protein